MVFNYLSYCSTTFNSGISNLYRVMCMSQRTSGYIQDENIYLAKKMLALLLGCNSMYLFLLLFLLVYRLGVDLLFVWPTQCALCSSFGRTSWWSSANGSSIFANYRDSPLVHSLHMLLPFFAPTIVQRTLISVVCIICLVFLVSVLVSVAYVRICRTTAL